MYIDGGKTGKSPAVYCDGAGSGIIRVIAYATLVNATITGTLGVNSNTPLFIGKDPTTGLGLLTNNGRLSLNVDGSDRVSLLIFNSPGSLAGTGRVTMTPSSLIYVNTSGDRITIGAGLPAGVSINAATGLLSGRIASAGTYNPFIEVNFQGPGGGVGPSAIEALTIIVTPAPGVKIAAVIPTVTARHSNHGKHADESPGTGQFVVTLSDPQPEKIEVTFAIAGSAVNGVNYAPINTTVKFKPGEISKNITINPLGKGPGAGLKSTVKLMLHEGDGYTIDTPGKVKVKIIGD